MPNIFYTHHKQVHLYKFIKEIVETLFFCLFVLSPSRESLWQVVHASSRSILCNNKKWLDVISWNCYRLHMLYSKLLYKCQSWNLCDSHKKIIWMLIVLTVNVPRNCDPVHLDSYGNTKMSLWKNGLIASLNLKPTSEMTSENVIIWQSIVASDQVTNA